MSNLTSPVPFILLCGSLGAGKTTFLMRLLEHYRAKGIRTGVVMNESGEVSIDGPLAGSLAQQVMNLAGGCVCCDTKDELAWSIGQLITEFESEVILLECSGIANPAEVVDAVTDAFVSRLTRLDRVIAIINPATDPATAYADPVVSHSIRYADDIVLNKRDLAIGPLWDGSLAEIRRINPHARAWEASHARIDLAAMLAASNHAPQPRSEVNVTLGHAPPHGRGARAAYHPMVKTVRLSAPLVRARFESWRQHLPNGVERAKGFFRFVDEPTLQEFQYASLGVNQLEPLHLLDEPPHAIVLIGRDYDQTTCETNLLACLAEN
ncbi:MAG: GTP-binding protein [Nitrospiraceae bacterium]